MVQKFHYYKKSLSANKYKTNIKKNHYNKNIIGKNHPGYLYYRELIINSKFNKKLLETIINPKSKSKSIFNNKDKYPKIYDTKNIIKKDSKKYFCNNGKKNHYYQFKTNKSLYENDYKIVLKGFSNGNPYLKTISLKNDYILKFINREIENHNNIFVKYKQKLVYKNSINKNIIFNNFVSEENNDKVFVVNKFKEKTNSNKENDKYLIKKNYNILFNNNKNLEINIKDDINYNELIDNKDIYIKRNKFKNKDYKEDDENFDEEQEKIFYKNQKNFYKIRKNIIEEPKYLEEDNEKN